MSPVDFATISLADADAFCFYIMDGNGDDISMDGTGETTTFISHDLESHPNEKKYITPSNFRYPKSMALSRDILFLLVFWVKTLDDLVGLKWMQIPLKLTPEIHGTQPAHHFSRVGGAPCGQDCEPRMLLAQAVATILRALRTAFHPKFMCLGV